jgi:hypothetical protein
MTRDRHHPVDREARAVAPAIDRLESNSREASEMLATLGFFLLTLLATCTLFLLICWVLDADRTAIEAGRDRPVILEFPVHPHRRTSHVRLPALTFPERCGVRGCSDRSASRDRAS